MNPETPTQRPADGIAAPVTPTARALTAGGVVLGAVTAVIVLGALTVRSGLIFGLVVLAAVFIPLERVFALRPQKILRAGWRTDLVHFFVNNLLANLALVVPVVVVGLGLRAVVPLGLRHDVVHQPAGLQFAEAFLLAELCGYAAHRAAHRVPLLWRFHKVHHTIREMDWLASAHLHPLDSVWTRSCVVLPLFALGFSRATFGGFLAFTTLQAIFIHANVRLTFGPLRWVIATPEFHHWHHANVPEAYNTNFAGEFPWIDALFGTLHLPKGRRPAGYGIDELQPAGYLRQLAWHFRHAA
jgi:sterol desaturase/sphingolipid hydroxylase (fatty acid hydroxylase superfamily)